MAQGLPYRALFFGVTGQVAVLMLTAALGAIVIPCCDNPTPEVPPWYASIATPVHFMTMLLPAFLCGLYAPQRPVLAGALVAGVGTFIWHIIGTHVIAALVPARGLNLSDFSNIIYLLVVPKYIIGLVVSAICYAAVGACAASAGFLLRGKVRRPVSQIDSAL